MKIKFILSLAILILLVSCKTNQVTEIKAPPPATFFETSGLQGKWTLEYISPVDGKDIKQLYKIQKPYLNFVDDTKVAGNNGCNNINGGYSISSNHSIQFDTEKFGATRMFCEGLDEKVFLNALKSVNKFDVIDDEKKLVLITGDIVTLSFVRAKD
ncbi:META domain-containing protein [Moheibacter sediminis]|uniref:META domain-containing protein n=1 Tax=Moheibacter sediminis TaxID=1434700 RepID=A0A1W2BUU4_9FLAO|nr:META domain-containing protein [Moheibacter sediminis]SMC76328.1 META domain-containing protein [Moheibacter sediminis]